MSTADILTAIQDSPVAHAISKSNHLVGAALQVVHVLGFIALLAALVLVSLRLLNFILRNQKISDVTRDADRLLYIGLAMTISSGVLMFVSSPKLYFYKWVFGLKMVLFLTAVLVHFALLRRVAASEEPNPIVVRSVVTVSLVVWFGIGFAGRMIGFT
jgi:uncharacterized membrane protein YcfT